MPPTEAEPRIWSERHTVRSFDVDFRKELTVEALCRYFLEGAWNHAEWLQVGYSHLEQHQQFWVLARLVLRIHGYPRWGEGVVLQTWPRKADTIFALREFELLDSRGTHLAGGSSAWLVLDAATKRPQRLQKLLSQVNGIPDRLAIGQEPQKLPPLKAGKISLETLVRYSDMDVNRHVNSARYLGWLLDSYSMAHHRENSVALVEVNYVGETLGGETVSIISEESRPGEWSHSIVKSGSVEVCRARVQWRPKDQ